MKPDPRFQKQPKDFWAHVRSISQELGYTERGRRTIKVPSLAQIIAGLRSLGLKTEHVADAADRATPFGNVLLDYFHHRAEVLNTFVEPRLMEGARAKKLFEEMCEKYEPEPCDIPWNKQKGKKKAPAYLTAIIGMIIRANAHGLPCDFDPRSLTTVTRDGKPVRTLARRVRRSFSECCQPNCRVGDQGVLLHDDVREPGC